MALFPGLFNRHFEVPSFDIKDLDTVDNAVIERIYEELERKDWSLLLAHCLGVDHCGHRYGPNHVEMSRKLRQMDQLVKNLTSVMDDDTLLVVMGDHGMTKTGDHGGESQMETEAALFVYSKKNLSLGLAPSSIGQRVDQIDFVPTFSLLLDLPIPFSNLGQLIEQLVDNDVLGKALELNAVQILRYAQQYMSSGGLEPALHDQLSRTLWKFENTNPSDNEAIAEANRQVIYSIKTLLRASLSTFDMALSLVGLLCLLETLFFHVHLVLVSSTISICQVMFRSALFLLQFSVYLGDSKGDVLVFLVLTTLLSSVYSIFLVFVYTISKQNKLLTSKSVGVFAALLFHSASYFSNSFVIYEKDVVRFLLQALLFYTLIKFFVQNRRNSKHGDGGVLRSKKCSIPIFALFLCMSAVRASKWFDLCREEYVDCVISTSEYGLRLQKLVVNCVMMGVCNYLLQFDLLSLFSSIVSRPKSPTLYLTSAISWPLLITIFVHWLCEYIPHLQPSKADLFLLGSQRSAQLVYLIAFIHFLLTTFFSYDFREVLQTQKHMLFLVLSMILGNQTGSSFAMLTFTILVTSVFLEEDLLLHPTFLYLFSQHSFFALAHQPTLTSIPWQAAFVGLSGNYWPKAIPALLVFFHMYAGDLMAVTSLVWLNEKNKTGPLVFLLFKAVSVIGCCAAGLQHRRHLMFFKIFAPKFIFQAVMFLFCCACMVLLSCYIFVKTKRIDYKVKIK